MRDTLDLVRLTQRVTTLQVILQRRRHINIGLAFAFVASTLAYGWLNRNLPPVDYSNPANLAWQPALSLLLITLEFLPILVLLVLLGRFGFKTRQRKENVQKILRQLIPDLEMETAVPQSSSSQRSWLTYAVLVFAILWLWSYLSPWAFGTLIGVALIIFLLWPQIAALLNGKVKSDERPQLRRAFVERFWLTVWFLTVYLLSFALLMAVLRGLGAGQAQLLILPAILATLAAYGSLNLSARLLFIKAGSLVLANGDYNAALATWQRWKCWIPWLDDRTLKGITYFLAGEQDLAGEIWWTLLKETYPGGNPLQSSYRLVNYALSLEETDPEAVLPLLEGAIRILPEDGIPYRALAAHLDRQNGDPERVYTLSNVALRYHHKPRIRLWPAAYDWSTTLGVQAEALAGMGRFEEAEQWI